MKNLKHIELFEGFFSMDRNLSQVNELKKSTYLSASEKLDKLGGKHKERANKIQFWANNRDLIKYGKFKVNASIDSDSDGALIPEGSIDAYIDINLCIDFYYDDPEFESIWIEVYGAFEDKSVYGGLFTITIPIERNDGDEYFTLKGDAYIEDAFSEEHKILFSDRGTANRFRRTFLNEEYIKSNEELYKNLRQIFLEFSSHEEFEKLFEIIGSIPTNQLYN